MRDLLAYALLGLLLCQVSYMFTISFTNAATATVIQSLGVGIIMLYGCVRGRKAPAAREVLALLLAVCGVFLVCTDGDPTRLVFPPEGMAWGLAAAVSFALYTLLPARLLEKWGSYTVMAYAMLIGGAVLVPFARPWAFPGGFDLDAWISLGAVVVVGTALAYGLFLQGVADAGSMKAGLFGSAVEPLSATIISIAWLKSQFTFATIAGFVLIVAMGIIITLGGRRK